MRVIKKIDKTTWLLLAVAAIFILLSSYQINRPFIGYHDFNNGFWGTFAKNNIRYGLQTYFALVANPDITSPQNLSYYLNHPWLTSLPLSISYLLFGANEISTRLVPLAFSLGTLFLIYLLGKKLFNRGTGLLAASLYTLLPIDLYFGKMMYDPLVLFFILLALFFYLDWQKTKQNRSELFFWLSLIISLLMDWPAYFVIPVIFLHFLIYNKIKNNFGFPIKLLGLPLVILVATLANFYFLAQSLDYLWQAFAFRLGNNLTWLNFLDSYFTEATNNFTTIILIATLHWFIFFSINALKSKSWSQIKNEYSGDLFLLLHLLFAVSYNLVFKSYVLIHQFLQIYLVPFVVLATARIIYWLLGQIKKMPHYKNLYLVLISLALILFLSQSYGEMSKLYQHKNLTAQDIKTAKLINQELKTDQIIATDVKKLINLQEINFYTERRIQLIEPGELDQPNNDKIALLISNNPKVINKSCPVLDQKLLNYKIYDLRNCD